MCLAVPGLLLERYEANATQMGRLDFGGVIREACLEYLPELEVGEYAIVHAGFAISRLDSDSAQQTLKDLAQFGESQETADD